MLVIVAITQQEALSLPFSVHHKVHLHSMQSIPNNCGLSVPKQQPCSAIESLLTAEAQWRQHLVNEEASLFGSRICKPITSFKLLCLQATSAAHCPWSEPSLRSSIVRQERSIRILLAARFISLGMQWEEMWRRLLLRSTDTFIRRLWMPSVLSLWCEEERDWESILHCAEPFKQHVMEMFEDCQRVQLARRNKRLWLEALQKKESEERSATEIFRKEIVLMAKVEQWEQPLRHLRHTSPSRELLASSPLSASRGERGEEADGYLPATAVGRQAYANHKMVRGYEEQLRRAEARVWSSY